MYEDGIEQGDAMTPLMQQYWEIKSAHEDKILLFRMGDFFEMFYQDAEIAAPILNIALTQRNKKAEDYTPMCGMPHHSIGGPISKLLEAGYKVAICDQIEDPKQAKGLVKRAVTRILSPGMVFDPDALETTQAHFICAFSSEQVAFLDTTTGEAFYYPIVNPKDLERLIHILDPKEILLTTEQKKSLSFLQESKFSNSFQSVFDELNLCEGTVWQTCNESIRRLVAYLKYMHNEALIYTLRSFEERSLQRKMQLYPTVIRHLEIFKNYRGGVEGSLFHSINRCKTSSGARLLKAWLQMPLAEIAAITKRQQQVEKWVQQSFELKELRKILAGMGDIERRLGKLSNPQCSPKDLMALAESLQTGLMLLPLCKDLFVNEEDVQIAGNIESLIRQTLVEVPPFSTKNGGTIQRGFSQVLDELIEYAENSQQLLVNMEIREKEATSIPSLKIRYNNVFGFYIEVTKTHTHKVPDHYKRKQTLTNAERYLTQELQELEEKVLSARTKRIELEEKIFKNTIEEILKSLPTLMRLAKVWAELDVYSALAWLAIERNYAKPDFSSDHHLKLVASRHPVVEQSVDKPFVPNDVELTKDQCLLLTGPNMAGKSTLMRQVALISILAQMGSFVPAAQAKLPLYENIFTRIGASDFLSEGLSTFMVEMKETAEMLKMATNYSLVILDEIGRGTSTYDGMSLAQAILEYLYTQIRCHTFFATHYHELTQMSHKFPQIKNAHMSIKEEQGDIHFLHTLVPGPANKSYGIQVARLAGLPATVTQRASRVLAKIEIDPQMALSVQMNLMEGLVAEDQSWNKEKTSVKSEKSHLTTEKDDIGPHLHDLLKEMQQVSIQQMTPLEALNKISQWQQHINEHGLINIKSTSI